MANAAENTAKKQRGRAFKPGKSGNPSGRPAGARNKATLAVEALLDGEAETLTRKAIELAKTGDMGALRLCMDRIVPPRRDRPICFTLPKIAAPADAVAAAASIVAAVAAGEITPSEAGDLGKLIDGYIRALETTDLAERLERLERMVQQ